MVANTVDDLLHGQRDPSWIFFEHVKPIVEAFLGSEKRVITIDDVFETPKKRREAEERIVREIDEYLQEGMPHLYATQQFFDPLIKRQKIRKPTDREVDIHFFANEEKGKNMQSTFIDAYAAHVKRIRNLDQMTEEAVQKLNDGIQTGQARQIIDPSRRIYLAFRHGALTISEEQIPQVVVEVKRIKRLQRMCEKFSRYMCLGILNYEMLIKELKEGDGKPRELKKKIRESLGAMHAYGLKTPFAEKGSEFHRERPDIMEFLMMHSRVSDILGTIYVGRSRRDALALMGRLTVGKFERSGEYEVLRGQRLRLKCGQWQYVPDFIIDDHMKSTENLIPGGNMNIFTYMVPKINYSKFNIRVDTGVYGLADHIEEIGVGKASHLRYERVQQGIVEGWRESNPKLYKLYRTICEALFPIVEQINLERYPLYASPRQLQRETGAEAK
jgi:hypothetical protein